MQNSIILNLGRSYIFRNPGFGIRSDEGVYNDTADHECIKEPEGDRGLNNIGQTLPEGTVENGFNRNIDIPLFVINLNRSVERRNNTIDQLKSLDLSYHFIEAIDAHELSGQKIFENFDISLWKSGSRTRRLLQGEIGCILSHFKIYRKMIDEDIEVACIIEDDIELQKDFKYFLSYENLKTIDWDLFYLGHHSQQSKKETCGTNKTELKLRNYIVGIPIELPEGSYAYIIKKEAATNILEHGYPIRMPMDHYIGNAPALGIRTCLLSPPCVNHNYLFSSTIYQESDIVYTKSFIEFFRKQIRKTYKWFPVLQTFRIWVNVKLNQFVVNLRKIGLLNKSYAKFY